MLEIVTPPPTGDLTVLATAKRELGVTGTDQDLRIADLICEASDLIAAYCNRDSFGRGTYRETWRLTQPREFLRLTEDLNVSVTTLLEDGVTLTADDFEVDGSRIYRLAGGLRSQWKASKVVVTYDAGFVLLTDLPRALERACLDLIQRLHVIKGRDTTVKQETIEGVGSVTYDTAAATAQVDALPADRKAALQRYTRYHL